MSHPEFWIRLGGVYFLAFAIFHVLFWRLFDWPTRLAGLDRINRGIMQTLNVCLTFLLFLTGFLLLIYTAEVRHTGLGRALLAGCGLFWLMRAALQWLWFPLQPALSRGLLLVFIAGAGIFFTPLLLMIGGIH